MSERNALLESIANTIKDYRSGEIPEPTPEHVDRWVGQFDSAVQLPLLGALDHVFKSTYLTKEWVSGFLGVLVKNEALAGKDPCAFWSKAHILRIQQHGHSQEEMLELFDEQLREQCGIGVADCGGTSSDYIYLDDVMFSGSRVSNDLAAWIENFAPGEAIVHVIVAAIHRGGEYFVGRRLNAAITASGKKIVIKYWRAITIENRKARKNNSEVLWPTAIPEDSKVKEYLARSHKYPFEPRTAGGNIGPFPSEEGRQLLERELLIAGVKIHGLVNIKDVLRPLGFSPFGLGFGSMIVTFRNCPNNCPLALWWGVRWYPLFPRKTYGQEESSGVPF